MDLKPKQKTPYQLRNSGKLGGRLPDMINENNTTTGSPCLVYIIDQNNPGRGVLDREKTIKESKGWKKGQVIEYLKQNNIPIYKSL
ncbi:MAG: hypothetical protein V1831_02045 [Candidatus Woesearchaeota archaeon]